MRSLLLVLSLVLAGCMPDDFQRQQVLWPEGTPQAQGNGKADRPELFFYLPAKEKMTGAAAIVAPGGSYAHTGGLRTEAFPTARWLVERGIVAVVLRYRVSGDGYDHKDFLADGRRAMQVVRSQASELDIDPNRIGMIGYSAGGHLAGLVAANCPKEGDPEAKDELERVSCRPDFVVMVYPVVTLDDRYTHDRSKRSLVGAEYPPSPELEQQLSLEQQVTADTPPTFLVHSRNDKKVVPKNSELLYEALQAKGVPSELHVYKDGDHGVGLAQRGGMPEMSTWPAALLGWLYKQKILK